MAHRGDQTGWRGGAEGFFEVKSQGFFSHLVKIHAQPLYVWVRQY
jgi:hypothetical protein